MRTNPLTQPATQPGTLPGPPLSPIQPPAILVVDDDPDIAYLLGQVLEGAGYRVTTAVHASEVLAHALRERPSLVLMDVILDGGDGIALTQLLHEQSELALVPVLLISARAHVTAAISAAGAQGGLDKPFPIATLLRHVATALHRSSGSG